MPTTPILSFWRLLVVPSVFHELSVLCFVCGILGLHNFQHALADNLAIVDNLAQICSNTSVLCGYQDIWLMKMSACCVQKSRSAFAGRLFSSA